jgi:4-alpha-glucanotransferase
MYSPDGQNWGFPIYDWPAHEADGFSWWKARIRAAERYYGAFRIDHVLGFFRIWATDRRYSSASLGRLLPYPAITGDELSSLGWDEARVRWMTEPHIPTGEVYEAVRNGGGTDADAMRVFDLALRRVADEELWLFHERVQTDKDIEALGIHPAGKAYLMREAGNRVFLRYSASGYAPLWKYRESRQYQSLSDGERAALDGFLQRKEAEAEAAWEAEGRKLLTALCADTPMLACAEDLGVGTACVPRVLRELGILSLKVVRWERDWDAEGQPYVPYADYPALSVCATSVHDSSTLREWWDRGADRDVFAAFNGAPSLPRSYNPGTARVLLRKAASAGSAVRVFPIIDLLHLVPRWYAPDSASERINVPGTSNDFNWTWRLPATIAELAADTSLINAVRALSNQ